MLPRVARSAATGEASNSLKLTVLCTAVMGGGVALVCTILPKLPLQVMFFNKPENWAAAPLVPWFAWAMTFFTLANVFLNDLFARRRFGVVAAMLALSVGYIAALQWLKPRLLGMEADQAYRLGVQVLCGFTLSMLAVAAGFVRFGKR
jgi:peptidoglycan biosynthesis protein MviN/MurJ (putative lipid II flippase)